MAEVDRPALNGFQLAIDQINAEGGALGRPFELETVDVQSRPEQAAAAARSLIDKGAVALGGFYDSDYALPAGKAANAAKIPFIASGATLPSLPAQAGPWFFMASYGDDDQARAGAAFARKTLGAKTAMLLTNRKHLFTQALGQYFATSFGSMGGKFVRVVTYDSASDYAPIKSWIKSGIRGDVVYVSCLPEDAGPIVKLLRTSGVRQPILSGDGMDTPDLAGVAGASPGNVYFTTHYSPNAKSDEVRKFVEAYRTKYGAIPSASAALGYDTASLIANAVKRAGSTEPERVRAALASTSAFGGVTGKISFGTSRKPLKPVTIVKLVGGRFEFVSQVSPNGE